MKKSVIILILVLTRIVIVAQTKVPIKRKDTIKTEVVNVITSYAPKITDAFKIKRKPVVKLSREVGKKKLDYQIVSVPVASTFIPKSGTLKAIPVAKKEMIFDNYLTLGYGNNVSPFIEGFIQNTFNYDSEIGIKLSFKGSFDKPVKNILLDSHFYNASIDAYYKQEERYFDWTAGIKVERDNYNWYGLPTNINYITSTIDKINEEQTYKNYNIYGKLDFPDSFFKNAEASIGYFSDIFKSNEVYGNINTHLAIPLYIGNSDLEDIHFKISFDYLKGSFKNSYERNADKKHSFFNIGLNPFYKFDFNDFKIKVGGKVYFSMNLNDEKSRFLLYPDVNISYPILPKVASLYAGVSGDLHQNSFKSFSNENPYISPTINILQTNEKYRFFSGLTGMLSTKTNFNIKASYQFQENMPLYHLQKSKSENGTETTDSNGLTLFGYEYGNSFNVVYDDVKNLSITGEIEHDFNKNITLGVSAEFNNYQLNSEQQAWNLPKLKGNVFAKYQADKWYATTNIFYVGKRKGMLYQNNNFNAINTKQYIDINFSGGYNITPMFSVFLKANNITNQNYQRFTNYHTQGLQIIGGIVWKFDSFL